MSAQVWRQARACGRVGRSVAGALYFFCSFFRAGSVIFAASAIFV